MSHEPLHVVLDLDETLILSKVNPMEGMVHDFVIDPDDCHFLCHIRPGAQDFCRTLIMDDRFQVGIYTAASADYAQVVINQLFGRYVDELEAVLCRDRTQDMQTSSEIAYGGWDVGLSRSGVQYRRKDLKKYRRAATSQPERHRIITLDDTPKAWEKSYGNLLTIPPFTRHEPDDLVLRAAFRSLEKLHAVPDVRPIEKRGLIVSMVQRMEAGPKFDN